MKLRLECALLLPRPLSFLPNPLFAERSRTGHCYAEPMNLAELADVAERQLPRSGDQWVQPLPQLGVFRQGRPSSFEASIFEPVLILVLRGRKETVLGVDSFPMGAGDCLLVSHDLPVIARVTKAPYLALLFDIQLEILRELVGEVGDRTPASSRAVSVHAADAALVDALARYLALAGTGTDAAVLGPLVTREIHYRLATAPFGAMLRSLVRQDSHASAIARAIGKLRRDFRAPIEIPALARSVGMSPPSFHKHFKAITASSPLQYQKELRLLEARRLLRAGGTTVTTAAFQVGYESPTQFSREFARKFGAPPKQDIPAA